MTNDPRARIFKPLAEFERSIKDLGLLEKRAARIAFLSDAIGLYEFEAQWSRRLKPHRFFWYVIPLTWPILWYRNGLSKMTRSAIYKVINECREKWTDDVEGFELHLEHIRDPLKPGDAY